MAFEVFDRYTERYDAWYDKPFGRSAFLSEVKCLKPLLRELQPPFLEVGVGTGRFARALGVSFGIDPARKALEYAQRRGVQTVQALGEALPFDSETFGGVFLVVTICFVDEPLAVLNEAYRVLRPGGGLVLGLVLAESPWAAFYRQKAREGSPFYAAARFYTWPELKALLQQAGFQVVKSMSTLFQPPGVQEIAVEEPRPGCHFEAGFVGVLACRSSVPILHTRLTNCRTSTLVRRRRGR